MPVFTTACPRNCYSTCGMRVRVEAGRLVEIGGHEGNRATEGHVCLKGLSYHERVRSPERLLEPLERTAAGAFQAISWEEALGRMAERFGAIREESGAQAILYYAASGTKGLLNGAGLAFWERFGGCTTTYGDLCWPAGLEATRLTLGDNKHNAPWDLERARLIVFWGKNAAETNVHQMVFVERARKSGAQVVVIDPRRTETAERADLFLQPRPGTDGALALAVAGELFRLGGTDEAFLQDHVSGLEAYRRAAAQWSVERAAATCGLAPEALRAFARLLVETRPATICAGYGMQRYSNGGQTIRAILALLVLTGNLGKPGAGWVYANLQTDLFGALRDPLALYPPSPEAAAGAAVRASISTARLGPEMLATRDPVLRAAWIERGNPVTQNPQTHATLEALRALEFRVVVDQFLTDTAREADLVLPAKSMFEQTDVIGAYWHGYLQLRQKVMEPPGAVKPETEVYRLLAERLGVELGDSLPAASDAGVEAWLEQRLAPLEGVDLTRLRQGPLLVPGFEEVAFADGVFPTPSGRIELDSAEARERWGVASTPEFVEPLESTAREDGLAARFPLQLLTPNTKNRIHSQFGNLAMIRDLDPEPRLDVHPGDAQQRGLADGDWGELYNERGKLRLRVRFDAGLRTGCVSLTNGWWLSQGGAANVLSAARETDLGHGAAFHDVLVELRSLPA